MCVCGARAENASNGWVGEKGVVQVADGVNCVSACGAPHVWQSKKTSDCSFIMETSAHVARV